MSDRIYTITLSDGTVLPNLSMNGNNFISNDDIDEEIFSGRLSTVEIYDGEETRSISPAELVRFKKEDDGAYHFVLRKISQDRLDAIKIQSDIEYIAMMSDIEL